MKKLCFAVDVTVYHRDFHGDLNETFFIGNVSDKAKKLVTNTWECLSKSMEIGTHFYQEMEVDWQIFLNLGFLQSQTRGKVKRVFFR
jgi:hypothetical protein